jgi:(2S)-methylsuccinyl-CoA dehydrogenase
MTFEITQQDLDLARDVIDSMNSAVESLARTLNKLKDDEIENQQVLLYDLAHSAAGLYMASNCLNTLDSGDNSTDRNKIADENSNLKNKMLALGFIADVAHDLVSKTYGRLESWGLSANFDKIITPFISKFRDPNFLELLWDITPVTSLDSDFELVAETFRRFAEEEIIPVAEAVHRNNSDVPENIIKGLADLGAFGLSVPEEYGGFATGGTHDYLGMVVATEELSRGSLGIGGSLITRPEILARALIAGGTETQKLEILPKLATTEIMAAVAVTEPDFGSDVASIKVTATKGGEGYYINGVKTWCTFAARANVLMLLARTDQDRTLGHRGLSLFIVDKPKGDSKGFIFSQDNQPGRPTDGPQGKMEGRPIDTLGYRGMHSYEIAFENWWVPSEKLIGEESGLGKGFYLQMQGFENGRLQTAARALGVMRASMEAAKSYAENRIVFGEPIINYQLTKAKIGRMNMIVYATKNFTYEVAKLMGDKQGSMEASMIKAYACKAAEWISREAMQIHGGMGYAEEFPVSRYFVDSRVLSIFEGADETLALKVIAKALLKKYRN